MNVLLTCAGRRNYFIEFFRKALGGQGQIFAADACSEAPALQEADRSFLVPEVYRSNYFDVIFDICQEYRVKLLISLNDLELPLLAKQRSRFIEAGIMPVISREEIINTCFDKWATNRFLRNIGLNVPRTYLSLLDACRALAVGELTFPLVVKPRWGTASIGIEYPEDMEELECAYKMVKKKIMRTILAEASARDPDRCVIIQELLKGCEYGLDIVNNLQEKYICTFIRKKLSMRAGETERASTVQNRDLDNLGRVIGQNLGHVAGLDCDVIINDRACFVLEMNPRFGGGYPFSQIAGADLPSALIAWAEGKEADKRFFKIEPNISAAKCDRIVITNKRALEIER